MKPQKSLLIVDEDRLFGELVKAAIGSKRVGVVLADSAEQAEREAAAFDPELILNDPAIDGGHRLLETWCSSQERCRLVAIVRSDQARRMARRANMDVIDKKDGLSDLIHLLRTRLDLDSLPVETGDQVLVVDDEEEIRELLKNVLTSDGYAVITAADGIEALEQLDKNPNVQVVLMDINMPRRGGLATLAELRKRKSPPDVIMTTAISDEEIANRSLDLGAFDYILKPLDVRRVESTISACLSNRHHRNTSLWKRLVGG